MLPKCFELRQVNITVFLVVVCLASGYQTPVSQSAFASSTTPKTSSVDKSNVKLNSGALFKKDQVLSPAQAGDKNEDDSGLIEVKEDEIPEGSLVYVLEEPEDGSTDGEILKTANNIVFRPLFRYREKQEAQRRNYNNRIRRRYFVPRRSYRNTYYPSYYYPYRYY